MKFVFSLLAIRRHMRVGFGVPAGRKRIVKRSLTLALALLCLHAAATRSAAAVAATGLTPVERQREIALHDRLCANKKLSCDYVDSIFADPRLTITPVPEPAPPPSVPPKKTRERNPYLTERFGLLTPASIERCRSFIAAHELAFDAAYKFFGVPREVICGHLRIETNFGMTTPLTQHPFGTATAVSRLVSLYVRKPSRSLTATSFAHRQQFAANQLALLLEAAVANGWDLFSIPGSPTGAIGLAQFEPSAFVVAADGNGDGKIDLFDPEDAIFSIARYLVSRGWSSNPEHQKRAVYAYYGGHYDSDPYKYYMKAVLKYADAVRASLQNIPLGAELLMVSTPTASPITNSSAAMSAAQPDLPFDLIPASQ
jgi:membrane-bound lytic murein transglycosylase B